MERKDRKKEIKKEDIYFFFFIPGRRGEGGIGGGDGGQDGYLVGRREVTLIFSPSHNSDFIA